MKIIRYNPTLKEEWNRFIRASRNGTFLLEREYMDYHQDRFADHSLLFYNSKGDLIALLPANEKDDTFFSHQGLTYGGFICCDNMHTALMLGMMESLISYLCSENFNKIIYKAIPAIYHNYPTEEDLYALFRIGATLSARSVSSVIDLSDPRPFNQNRRRGVKKAAKSGLTISESEDFSAFWEILTDNLQKKFHTQPVHSLEEISSLHRHFPENIRCYQIGEHHGILGGVVVYETPSVAHIQYISASDEGKEWGALDNLFDYLIHEKYIHKRWFDFGISTEAGGSVLNEGLIRQKEGFGARAIVYDTYQIDLKA